ncbi:MAG: gfo/Idh/MocA family oxidoreductase, partial [Clostridia bacterium]|nr:gfo/Idh/MocA family oxidoreductase [Clostridia bacterium]
NWDCDGEIVMVSDWENREAVPIVAGAGITKTMAPRTDDTIKRYPLPVQKADWGEYYKNIFDVILNGKDPIVTHDQQRRLMKLVEAVFESGKTNKVVEFNDVI